MKTKTNMCLATSKGLDLRFACYKDYIDTIDTKTLNKGLKNKIINLCVIFPFYFWIFIILFILMGLVVSYIMPWYANANDDRYYTIKTISNPLPGFLYDNVKIECNKQKTKNIHNCIKTTLAVNYAESTWNIPVNFWIRAKDNNIKWFVTRYNKFWYKAKEWSFFYGSDWKVWKSHYCTSEKSSWSVKWCPNGEKNFNYIFFDKELDVFIKKYMK